MKLSEAILEGSKKRPQVFGQFYNMLDCGCYGTCALGAAYEALTGTLRSGSFVLEFIRTTTAVPYPIIERVIELNDTDHINREDIAAWLAEQGY